MEWYELENRTRVYWDDVLGTLERAWLVGTPSLENGLIVIDRYEWGFIGQQNLPREFLEHQVRTLDAQSDSAVMEFAGNWGLPFSPFRVSPYRPDARFIHGDSDPVLNDLAEAHALAMEQTNNLGGTPGVIPRSIAIEEARATIRLLQLFDECHSECIRLMGHVKQNDLPHGPYERLTALSAIVNASLTASNEIDISRIRTGNVFPPNLTSAICNQIIETIEDEAPWRECVECGQLFKRKQSRALNAAADSAFCCDKCADRNRQRNYRKNKARKAKPTDTAQ